MKCNLNNIKYFDDNDAAFTLVELMIVVTIVAVLAGISVVAYSRHVKSGRIVGARAFIAEIQARQETYFQQNGQYAAENSGFFPALVAGEEPVAKAWSPAPAGWIALGARPQGDHAYFGYRVGASNPAGGTPHALDAIATGLGIPAQPAAPMLPHPWYYIIAHGDLDGDATYSGGGCSATPIYSASQCTVLTATSARSVIVALNEGE